MSEEELAKAFAHFIYRSDPIVERYHCKNAVMDEEVYAAVLGAVSKNLRRIARNRKALALTEEEAASAVKKMYPSRAMEFGKYMRVFELYGKYPPSRDWDAPVFPETQPPKDKAAFILGGAFREGCARRWRFDDGAMCRTTRIYVIGSIRSSASACSDLGAKRVRRYGIAKTGKRRCIK